MPPIAQCRDAGHGRCLSTLNPTRSHEGPEFCSPRSAAAPPGVWTTASTSSRPRSATSDWPFIAPGPPNGPGPQVEQYRDPGCREFLRVPTYGQVVNEDPSLRASAWKTFGILWHADVRILLVRGDERELRLATRRGRPGGRSSRRPGPPLELSPARRHADRASCHRAGVRPRPPGRDHGGAVLPLPGRQGARGGRGAPGLPVPTRPRPARGPDSATPDETRPRAAAAGSCSHAGSRGTGSSRWRPVSSWRPTAEPRACPSSPGTA